MFKLKSIFPRGELLIAGALGLGLLVSATSVSALPKDCDNVFNNRFRLNWLSNLESDGPYPGATRLQDYPGQGANSTETWKGDSGTTLQSSWVQCPPGKIATGGGFSRADEAETAFRGLQIITSRPAQFCNAAEGNKAIPGDAGGSIVPNAWLVEGFNNNATGELIVRPWVVCVSPRPFQSGVR
jgi:hypothetical protein